MQIALQNDKKVDKMPFVPTSYEMSNHVSFIIMIRKKIVKVDKRRSAGGYFEKKNGTVTKRKI